MFFLEGDESYSSAEQLRGNIGHNLVMGLIPGWEYARMARNTKREMKDGTWVHPKKKMPITYYSMMLFAYACGAFFLILGLGILYIIFQILVGS